MLLIDAMNAETCTDSILMSELKFPKHSYIRSKKLLRLVASLDCQLCGSQEVVQAAHTNWGGGKGRSIKADDNLVAALCMKCAMFRSGWQFRVIALIRWHGTEAPAGQRRLSGREPDCALTKQLTGADLLDTMASIN
jgi:transcription elongation factor Elf1